TTSRISSLMASTPSISSMYLCSRCRSAGAHSTKRAPVNLGRSGSANVGSLDDQRWQRKLVRPDRCCVPRGCWSSGTDVHSRGRGREECQILWLSSWDAPEVIAKVVHPKHVAHRGGFVLEDRWLNDFWMELGNMNMGIRVQVHTHPQEAFHSPTDDEFPI